jgi:hypothetical protein
MTFRTLLAGLVLLFVSCSSKNANDAWLGAWVMDVKQSNWETGGMPQSNSSTIERNSDGMIRVVGEMTDAAGNHSAFTFTAKPDGTPVTVEVPAKATLSLTRIDARMFDFVQRTPDGVIVTTRTEVSQDGTTSTGTALVSLPDGRKFTNKSVFKRK